VGFLTGKRGLAGVILVLVIAWALAAVLMLTGTLLAARDIDDRVEVITREVKPADRDLDAVRLAATTSRIADRILEAARPLSGQLDQVIRATHGIDRSARSILVTAGSIGDTVESIHTTVGSIHGTVGSIESTAGSIGGHVNSIGRSVGGIHSRARTILLTTRSIDAGVEAINRRALIVTRLVRAIKSDTGSLLEDGLAHIGPEHGPDTDATLHGHANSIDCSPLVRTLGQARGAPSYCGR
jgi:methyl-accepting chemotaxis protein